MRELRTVELKWEEIRDAIEAVCAGQMPSSRRAMNEVRNVEKDTWKFSLDGEDIHKRACAKVLGVHHKVIRRLSIVRKAFTPIITVQYWREVDDDE